MARELGRVARPCPWHQVTASGHARNPAAPELDAGAYAGTTRARTGYHQGSCQLLRSLPASLRLWK